MRLNITPLVVADGTVTREFKNHAQQVNAVSEGRLVGTYNAQSSVPTNGAYAVGDVVRNSAPAELGSTPNKYVVYGWMCLDDNPLTFVQMRFLTGN